MTDPTAAVPGAEWNAQAYDRLANPMQSWGEIVLGRMELRGDETALDLGCGSGRLTEHLLRRLPRGRVIAIDRSANMLDAARAHLEPLFPGQTEYVQRSLELIDFDGVADLAFSNAALHWVPDHPKLFAAIFRALEARRLAGRPVRRRTEHRCAFASARRCSWMPSRMRPYFEGWPGPWEFASPKRPLSSA